MNPSKPIQPDPVDESQDQGADVGSDRNAPGNPSKKAPLPIKEIEELENDAEGG